METVIIHSVGTFRGTSSKTRHVEHPAWMNVSWMETPFGAYHEPVFLRTFHEESTEKVLKYYLFWCLGTKK
jgi:hypothetical protein